MKIDKSNAMAKNQILKGLAGAAALAGATQSYGAVVNMTLPTNIPGHAPSSAGTTREYYNVETGVTTSTAGANPGYDLNLGYYNNSTTNEFFTGIYVNGGTGLVSYYASNSTNYAYGLPVGSTIGTGGDYATFGQKAGYYTILSLTYNGTAYAIMKPGQTYYIGFQFLGADGFQHDGWMEVESDTYTSASSPGGFTFIAGAYNSTPDSQGGTIMVGQTAAVPEPGTLSALAVGAAMLAGVGLKRRRRAAAAA